PGPRYLTVHVPPQPEEPEHLRSNNTESAYLRVSEEKIRVLYIEGLPRWDFRFLKNLIRRDHGLGGVSPALLDREFIALLDKAVREKGVGLIVQPGPLSMPHRFDTKLHELL